MTRRNEDEREQDVMSGKVEDVLSIGNLSSVTASLQQGKLFA